MNDLRILEELATAAYQRYLATGDDDLRADANALICAADDARIAHNNR